MTVQERCEQVAVLRRRRWYQVTAKRGVPVQAETFGWVRATVKRLDACGLHEPTEEVVF